MRIIFLGAPGSGKGTQANFVCSALHIPYISTGDRLRAAVREKTPLGLQIKHKLEKGYLVKDEIVIALVKNRIAEPDCQSGFLLDGFPRTIPQAEALIQSNIDIDFVIELKADDNQIIRRLSGRRIHPASSRSYHLDFNPPKNPGFDDITGEPLVQRADDTEESVKNRLSIYHQQTKPLIAYYQNLRKIQKTPQFISIDGTGELETVRKRIFKTLKIEETGGN